jgi:hypothetical protein
MKSFSLIIIAAALFFNHASFADNQEHKYKLLIAQITGVQQLAKQSRFIQAAKKQNEQNRSLSEIKKLDKAWIASGPDYALKQSMSANPVGKFLKNVITNNNAKYNEAFLTDAQGANVAAHPITSDYWQGDETKFTAAFANGKGDIYIGDIEFDESTQTNAVQISVPVKYNSQAIGVLVMGVKVDHILADKLRGK